jgi:hypothetical protein
MVLEPETACENDLEGLTKDKRPSNAFERSTPLERTVGGHLKVPPAVLEGIVHVYVIPESSV